MAAPARWSHRPALDGVRGGAVVAVVAYHLGFLRGGFLGVDVFLVLSGYLITGLAIGEIGRTGGLGLRAFWGRRVRRLVPALLVVVACVTAVALAIGWPRDQLQALGWDGIATLTWWANWRQVQGPSYWASGENLFRHAWSLSIEEQFYVVWPLVLVGSAAVGRRTSRSVVAIVGTVALAGAVASAGWNLWLSYRLAPEDLSRVYVGTDARALAPLLGCALACALAGDRSAVVRGRAFQAAGLIAAAVLAWFVVTAEVASPALYRTGVLIIVSLAAATVVAWASGIEPGDRSVVGRVLASPAPRYLGLRSYAIYLWSWPIQVLVRFQWPEMAGRWVAVITVGTTLALAEISYRVVEDPIRRHTGWASRDRVRRPAWAAASLGAVGVLALAFVVAVPPPAHERIDTAESADAALRPADITGPIAGPGDRDDGLRVLITGDSVAWAIGAYHQVGDGLPEGIASVDSRAIIGCGLLTPEGWAYPQGGIEGLFTVPGSGRCAEQPTAEQIGLSAGPDVVMLFPGAWEWSEVRSPDGEVIPALSQQMADILRVRLLQRIDAANRAGARFVMVAYACPGPRTADGRKDPDFVRWINALLRSVVDDAVAQGADAELLEPTNDVCVDGDPLGEPTPEKLEATDDEIHVRTGEGGAWMWSTWLAPALARP